MPEKMRTEVTYKYSSYCYNHRRSLREDDF